MRFMPKLFMPVLAFMLLASSLFAQVVSDGVDVPELEVFAWPASASL